jgi:hypothetical protein
MSETFKRSSTKLNSINPTTLYTASGTGIVLSCLVANVDGTNNADITVQVQDTGSSVLSHIVHQVVVPAEASLELVVNKLVLLNGEKLVATASAPDDLDVTISVLEMS